jgi:RHS repeat-associated protein
VAEIEAAVGQRTSFGQAFVGEAQSSAQQAKDLVAQSGPDLSKAKGPLGKAAAALGLLVSLEQVLSGPFSLIPFPAMPAVRVGDLAFGLPHAHNHPPNLIPPAPPIPLPSLGPVLPLPWGISGAEKTLINGRPAARCGDMGIGIWCGGWFPLYEILLGSSSVWIEGARAARLGVDLTRHCLFSGVPKPSDIPILGVPLGLTVTASQNVIIGGFPLPSLTSLFLGVALKPLGIGLSKLVNAAKQAAREAAERATREAAERAEREAAERAAREAPRKPAGNRVDQGRCTRAGHPVDVASGRVFTSQTDFELPGRIPIAFTRVYDSSAIDYEGPLGRGWMHPYDLHLWVDDRQEMVILRNEEALLVGFNRIAIGEQDFNPLEKQWLERLDDKAYVVRGQDGLRYTFASLTAHDVALEGTSEATALRLIEIADHNGNRIDLAYEDGRLSFLQDGAGTQLTFSYLTLQNGTVRLAEVSLALDEILTRTDRLVNFTYNEPGCLINATDRGQVPWRYAYDDHLLIRETNRNGLSFHFAYQGKGKDARCIHTWGDGGIYERRLDYDPEARMTIVEDSLGAKTTYYFNAFDLPVRIIDVLGGETQYSYGSKGELLSETDEIGRTTKYKYNAQGDCISMTHPNGTVRRFAYTSDSLPQKLTDEMGAEFTREYDERGNVIVMIDALGNRREYSYNQFGDLEKVVDPLGGVTKFKWNAQGQIIECTTPLGATTRYGYDERGRLVGISDPLGNATHYTYDALDRLAQVERPDGTTQHYEYDPEGNLTKFLDANGAETRFRYVDYNKLGERMDALGYTRRFVYDTEANLVEVRNERGEAYRFAYDALDRVTRKVGFDGLRWEYMYDTASQLIACTDPAGRTTRLIRDLQGQVIERQRPDGTVISFRYDPVGRLTAADAPESELAFGYDALGRVIWESQNGQVIAHEYDALGRRIKRRSPAGQTVEFTYDADSQLSRLQTPRGSMEFEYDKAERMAKRRMPGELEESFYYDRCGRLIEQSLHKPTHMLLLRRYTYDAEGNLIELSDSKKGTSRFVYDPVERLREVLPRERVVERFIYDSTDNLLQRGAHKFYYGAPDRLTRTDDATLIYDEVGNLIERQQFGAVIRYSYDCDDRLIAVESEEGGRIEFAYDVFGRRIMKKTKDSETDFLWDGDVLLSDRQSDSSNEYIFNLDGYEPLCRFDETGLEAYHNDHLGTPHELTNEIGQVVWSSSYDVYGKIRGLHACESENQIRFQGQYEDCETGLYYNFFRYYDPDIDRYITQDPTGLPGGFNLYAYPVNPLSWIDPLGLSRKKRREYAGKTPGVNSRTGREVQKRMTEQGTFDSGTKWFMSREDGKWYPIKEAHMAHETDVVRHWNRWARVFGARDDEIRNWMLNSKNYYLERGHSNTQAGARLNDRYFPPVRLGHRLPLWDKNLPEGCRFAQTQYSCETD